MNDNFFKDKNILVTGASGFIGRALISKLMTIDSSINIVTASRYDGDYRDINFWQHKILSNNIDFIYHLAGETSLYKCEAEPLYSFEANVAPMLAILEACKIGNRKPFILFTGTCCQVGLPDVDVIDENTADKPVATYDIHKLTAELHLKQYIKAGYVTGCSFRLANIYNNFDDNVKQGSNDRGILNRMYQNAITKHEITIYGDGEYNRDYVHIDDLVAKMLAAPQKQAIVNGRHLLIASGKSKTLKQAFTEVALKAEKQTGNKVKIIYTPWPDTAHAMEYRNFKIKPSSLLEQV